MARMRLVVLLVMGIMLFSVIGLWAEEPKKTDEATAGKAVGEATTEKPAEEAKKDEEPKVTGAGAIGFYNRYIFRGYEIGKSGFVIQPSLTASYRGFSAGFWANYDTNQRNTTSAVFSNEGSSGVDEGRPYPELYVYDQ